MYRLVLLLLPFWARYFFVVGCPVLYKRVLSSKPGLPPLDARRTSWMRQAKLFPDRCKWLLGISPQLRTETSLRELDCYVNYSVSP